MLGLHLDPSLRRSLGQAALATAKPCTLARQVHALEQRFEREVGHACRTKDNGS
jgi:hypothetical protein